MSHLEAHDESSKQAAGGSESLAAKLFADAHHWFEHQSAATRAAEVGIIAVAGGAAIALAGKRLRSIESVAKATHFDGALSELERQTSFAGKEYLEKPYLLSPGLEHSMVKLAENLTAKFPEFNSIVVAGGQSNGSFVFRSLTKARPASDLDYYLVGRTTTPGRLGQISKNVGEAARENKLTVDGCLNGTGSDVYLNLDQLGKHIENHDYNLLALPFQAAYGAPEIAQRAVLQSVLAHPDKDVVWERIRDAHAESLSMHHGSWTLDFNNSIVHHYMPRKIEKFGLPESPELAMKKLAEKSTDRP